MLERPPNVVPWNWVAVGKICWPRNSSSVDGAACAGPAATSAIASSRTSLVSPVFIPSAPYYASRYAAKASASTTHHERRHGDVDTAEHEPGSPVASPPLGFGGEILGLLDWVGHAP